MFLNMQTQLTNSFLLTVRNERNKNSVKGKKAFQVKGNDQIKNDLIPLSGNKKAKIFVRFLNGTSPEKKTTFLQDLKIEIEKNNLQDKVFVVSQNDAVPLKEVNQLFNSDNNDADLYLLVVKSIADNDGMLVAELEGLKNEDFLCGVADLKLSGIKKIINYMQTGKASDAGRLTDEERKDAIQKHKDQQMRYFQQAWELFVSSPTDRATAVKYFKKNCMGDEKLLRNILMNLLKIYENTNIYYNKDEKEMIAFSTEILQSWPKNSSDAYSRLLSVLAAYKKDGNTLVINALTSRFDICQQYNLIDDIFRSEKDSAKYVQLKHKLTTESLFSSADQGKTMALVLNKVFRLNTAYYQANLTRQQGEAIYSDIADTLKNGNKEALDAYNKTMLVSKNERRGEYYTYYKGFYLRHEIGRSNDSLNYEAAVNDGLYEIGGLRITIKRDSDIDSYKNAKIIFDQNENLITISHNSTYSLEIFVKDKKTGIDYVFNTYEDIVFWPENKIKKGIINNKEASLTKDIKVFKGAKITYREDGFPEAIDGTCIVYGVRYSNVTFWPNKSIKEATLAEKAREIKPGISVFEGARIYYKEDDTLESIRGACIINGIKYVEGRGEYGRLEGVVFWPGNKVKSGYISEGTYEQNKMKIISSSSGSARIEFDEDGETVVNFSGKYSMDTIIIDGEEHQNYRRN